MSQFIKEQMLQKKLPGSVQKWLTEYTESEETKVQYSDHLWRNLKLFEDLHNCIIRCSNPSGLHEICTMMLKIYKLPSYMYTLTLYPFLFDAYTTNSASLDLNKKKTEERSESSRYSASMTIDVCVCTLSNFFILRMKEAAVSKRASNRQNEMNLWSIQENGSFISDSSKLSNLNYDSCQRFSLLPRQVSASAFVGRNHEFSMANMLEEYVDSFLSCVSLDILADDTVAYHSVHAMAIFFRKYYSAQHSQRCPKLLYQSLRFIDTVLNRFCSNKGEIVNARMVSHSIYLLFAIERLATYLCLVSTLMVANSLIHVWTKKLGGDLHLFVQDETTQQNEFFSITSSQRRASQFEDQCLSEIDLSQQLDLTGADLQEQHKRTKSRGLSNAELITNASFKPVIVPEDITYDGSFVDQNITDPVLHSSHQRKSKVLMRIIHPSEKD